MPALMPGRANTSPQPHRRCPARQALCGPKGQPDARRRAYRGGHTLSSVVVGGQRIGVQRPRVRSVESVEVS
jgi:hypothetical protein